MLKALNTPKIDVLILLAIVSIMLLGSLTIWSASGYSEATMTNHLRRCGISILCVVIMASIPARQYRRVSPYLYLLTILLLIGVVLVGDSSNGSQRWLSIAGFRFQPSELVKLAIPMMVAWFIQHEGTRPTGIRLLVAILMTAIPAGLIFVQPDLDGAIFGIIYMLFVLYFAGMSWKIIGGFVALVATSIPLLWFFVIEAYQKKRIVQFLNPQSDPLGSGYQIIQSHIAIGSGGVTGKGWMNATQSSLGFIPESHTDFIFSAYAEEWGFLGCVLLLSLYLFITLRALWLACHCHHAYSRLVCGSLALSFFLYAFINTGMVSGLLPVMGSPLPFFSYGGTAMITQGVCFGIIMSLCRASSRYE
ncbi:rod shape-determining protein RodA [Vibrio sp. SCSIO 43140]|uniref:rod shape-determining protein RodA n=1 Tax=Vibrio sp. SCSIO 43140 TaxID=2819100 RepID=UPI00207610CC|nr:rod shape-determining protein RodA [Vibrio sp. SCSIO 43140]USD59199.1 rod shape-determining protein RodA [Vibrio sp. SCSIO 43140]